MEKHFISASSLLRDSMKLARLIIRSGRRPFPGGHVARRGARRYHGAGGARVSRDTRRSHRSGPPRIPASTNKPRPFACMRPTTWFRVSQPKTSFSSSTMCLIRGAVSRAVMSRLKRRCRRNLPAKVRIATVYYKPTRNRSALVPDYYVRATDAWLVSHTKYRASPARRSLQTNPLARTSSRQRSR